MEAANDVAVTKESQQTLLMHQEDCNMFLPRSQPGSNRGSWRQHGSYRRESRGSIGTSRTSEGGWGWVVCACACATQAVTSGSLLAYGVLSIELRNGFSKDNPMGPGKVIT